MARGVTEHKGGGVRGTGYGVVGLEIKRFRPTAVRAVR